MLLLMTGINQKSAPVNIREQFSLSDEQLEDALHLLKKTTKAREALILSTCNRIETYTIYTNLPISEEKPGIFFEKCFKSTPPDLEKYLKVFKNEEVVRHIFRVASSLDSMVVGEPQILGQVKKYFQKASDAGTTGIILSQLFRKAIETGKKIRRKTAVGRTAVSIPIVAVKLAKKILGPLDEKNVVIIGSGKIGELTAKNLRTAGVKKLFTVDLNYERAQSLALKLQGIPIRFDPDFSFLTPADIVITSTSTPHYIFKKLAIKKIMKKRNNNNLLFIDISVPRNVDPAVSEIENVSLYNIDDLEIVVKKNMRIRKSEVKKAEAIVEEEVKKFNKWLAILDVLPILKSFRTFLEDVCQYEFDRIFKQKEKLTPELREKIEYYGKALINKVAHLPTAKIKKSAGSEEGRIYTKIIKELFDL